MSVAIEKFASSARLNLSTSDLSGLPCMTSSAKASPGGAARSGAGKGFADHVVGIEKAKREGKPGRGRGGHRHDPAGDSRRTGRTPRTRADRIDDSRPGSRAWSSRGRAQRPAGRQRGHRLVRRAPERDAFTGRGRGRSARGIVVLRPRPRRAHQLLRCPRWLAGCWTQHASTSREFYLARLSEGGGDADGNDPLSFAGGSPLPLSNAPYLCDACGRTRRLIDCERDAEAIRSRNAPGIPFVPERDRTSTMTRPTSPSRRATPGSRSRSTCGRARCIDGRRSDGGRGAREGGARQRDAPLRPEPARSIHPVGSCARRPRRLRRDRVSVLGGLSGRRPRTSARLCGRSDRR